jgi:hypothetical protein
MAAPAWLTGVFAALMLTVAAYCAGRLVAARRWRRPTEVDTDVGHVLMGAAMAGMLVARLRILPAATWEAVFAGGAAWFAWQLLQSRRRTPASPWRCLHPAPHLVECAAMLYMFGVLPAALPGRGAAVSMAGMAASAAGSRFSFLALAMALFMVGYVVRVADGLTLRTPALAFSSASQRAASQNAASHGAAGPGTATQSTVGQSTVGQNAASGHGGCGPAGSRLGLPCLAPRCAALCKIAMGITMGYMLVLML